MAKSNVERQKEFRKRLADRGLRQLYVRGENGYYDARVRLAAGLGALAAAGELPRALRDALVERALAAMPPRDPIDERYLKGELERFLAGEEKPANTDIFDPDLNPLLAIATNDELQFLVDLLLGNANNGLAGEEAYKKFAPDHRRYADLIAKDLREFGGNTVATFFRGAGPDWRTVVRDVAGCLRVDPGPKAETAAIADAVLESVVAKRLGEMSDEDKQALLRALGRAGGDRLGGAELTAAAVALFREGGARSYALAAGAVTGLAACVGLMPRLALGAGAGRLVSLIAGPVGVGLTGLWAGFELAGPAYRVTVPAVAYLALLRRKYALPPEPPLRFCGGCGTALPAGAKFCPECGQGVGAEKS